MPAPDDRIHCDDAAETPAPCCAGFPATTVKVPPPLRPCTPGLYISSACAAGMANVPAVVARARYDVLVVPDHSLTAEYTTRSSLISLWSNGDQMPESQLPYHQLSRIWSESTFIACVKADMVRSERSTASRPAGSASSSTTKLRSTVLVTRSRTRISSPSRAVTV